MGGSTHLNTSDELMSPLICGIASCLKRLVAQREFSRVRLTGKAYDMFLPLN
jgi:hypothetical protein